MEFIITYVISRIRDVPQDLSWLFCRPAVICTSCSGQLTVYPRISLVNFLRQDYISSVTYYRPSHVLSRDRIVRQSKKKFEKKRINDKRDSNGKK